MAHEASSPPVRQRCVAHVHLAGLTSPTPNPAQTSDTLTSSILVHKFDPGAPGLLTHRHTNHVSKAVVEVNSSNGFALRVRLAQFVLPRAGTMRKPCTCAHACWLRLKRQCWPRPCTVHTEFVLPQVHHDHTKGLRVAGGSMRMITPKGFVLLAGA